MRISFTSGGGMAHFPGLQKPVEIDVEALDASAQQALRGLLDRSRFFNLPSGAAPVATKRRQRILTRVGKEWLRCVAVFFTACRWACLSYRSTAAHEGFPVRRTVGRRPTRRVFHKPGTSKAGEETPTRSLLGRCLLHLRCKLPLWGAGGQARRVSGYASRARSREEKTSTSPTVRMMPIRIMPTLAKAPAVSEI